MNDQIPTFETPSTEASKSRFSNPFRKSDKSTDKTVKTNSIKEKAKTGLAVVGAVTVAGVALTSVAKRRGADKLEVTLPTVDVTEDAN